MTHNNPTPQPSTAHGIFRTFFILTLLIGSAGILLYLVNRNTIVPASWGIPAGPRATLPVLLQDLVTYGTGVISAWLGMQLANRQPGHPLSWLLLLYGLSNALMILINGLTVYFNFTLASPGPLAVWLAWVMNWIWVFSAILAFLLIALFPDGHLLSPRWRWVLVVIGLFSVGMVLQAVLFPVMDSAFSLPNPLPTEVFPDWLLQGLFLAAVLGFILSIIALFLQIVARYRASSGETRQQMKWLVASVAASLVLILLGIATGVFGGLVTGQLAVNLSLAIPILGIGIGVLRYRLWDIDLIIRRTVVYGLLTALLGLTFFGGVALLQQGFVQLTGQESPLAVVLSTLAIAALFNPLRVRIQNAVDRRFYRSRLDSRLALERFQEQLRSEVDLQAVQHGILQVVQETLEPELVSLWLRPGQLHAEDS